MFWCSWRETADYYQAIITHMFMDLLSLCGIFERIAGVITKSPKRAAEEWEQYLHREPLTQRMEGVPEDPPFTQFIQQPEFRGDTNPDCKRRV